MAWHPARTDELAPKLLPYAETVAAVGVEAPAPQPCWTKSHRDRCLIDVEQRALRALEQDALPSRRSNPTSRHYRFLVIGQEFGASSVHSPQDATPMISSNSVRARKRVVMRQQAIDLVPRPGGSEIAPNPSAGSRGATLSS